MKKRFLPLVSVLVLSLFAPCGAEEESTPMADVMSEMNGYYKKMRRTEDATAGAELAREAQRTAIESLQFTPQLTEETKTGAEKVKDVANYRRLIGATFVSFCELELAFLEEDFDKVGEIIDDLRDLKKEGHKAYIKED